MAVLVSSFRLNLPFYVPPILWITIFVQYYIGRLRKMVKLKNKNNFDTISAILAGKISSSSFEAHFQSFKGTSVKKNLYITLT